MIEYSCSKCGDKMSSPDSLAGQQETCPDCGNVNIVPQPQQVTRFQAQAAAPPACQPSQRDKSQAVLNVKIKGLKSANGLGIAALVLGIIAALTCWIPFVGIIGIPLAALGLVFGLIGFLIALVGRKSGVGMPISGLIVCVISIIVAAMISGGAIALTREARNKQKLVSIIDQIRTLEKDAGKSKDKKSQAAEDLATEAAAIGSDAVEPLIAAIHDESELVTLFSIEVLSRMGDRLAIVPLQTFAKDTKNDGNLRWMAARALSRIDKKSAVDPLIILLTHSEPFVQSMAISTLGDIGDKRAVEALSKLLQHEDAVIRMNAEEALKKLGQNPPDTLSSPLPDEDKKAYFDKIILKNIEVGKSVLGEPGVFGEIKNDGNRTLKKVEIMIYCLDKKGKPVFEKNYHPVLVTDSDWSMRDDRPLKPNYSQKFGCKLDDAPSEWAGKVKLVVVNIEFVD